jgi:hypothetical protein
MEISAFSEIAFSKPKSLFAMVGRRANRPIELNGPGLPPPQKPGAVSRPLLTAARAGGGLFDLALAPRAARRDPVTDRG